MGDRSIRVHPLAEKQMKQLILESNQYWFNISFIQTWIFHLKTGETERKCDLKITVSFVFKAAT